MTGQNVWSARRLAAKRWNRKSEVAGAAPGSSGEGERKRVKKGKIFGSEVILFVDTNL
jgi:hypothetical protein